LKKNISFKKRKMIFIGIVAAALVLVLIGAAYLLYRRQASASVVSSDFPAWASNTLQDRVMHYWSEQQTWSLREVLAGRSTVLLTDSCGRTTQVTPNANEIDQLGQDVKVFVSYSGKPQLAQGDSSAYTDPFRIAVKAGPIKVTSGDQGTMDVALMFTNQSSHTMYLRGFEVNYQTMGIAPGQSASFFVGGGNDNPDKTQITAFDAGRSTSPIIRTVNLSGISNAAYTIMQVRVVPYYVQNGNVTYQYGSLATNQEIISCFIEPFDIHALGGGSTAYSMAAEPSAAFTKTYPHISYHSFPKGFSVFGTTKTISRETFSEAGLYLYRFDGENNQWQYYPGAGSFDANAFYGYYVYNPSSAKTLSLPYDLAVVNLYQVTKGWNMLWSVNEKSISQLQLEIDGQIKSVQDWASAGKTSSNVFIIDNDQSKIACEYFKLLTSSDAAANCSAGQLGTSSKIPAGKAFWVYVN